MSIAGTLPLTHTAGVVRVRPAVFSTRTSGASGIAVAEYVSMQRSAVEMLVAVPGLVLGTGSVASDTLFRLISRRGTGAIARVLVVDAPSYIEATQPTSEVVNAIRSAFELSVTDLAAVLGVERPTVYSWLKDQSKPSPTRIERMALVLRIADTWTALTGGGIAPALDSTVAPGLDLLAALRAPKLWEREIIDNLRAQAMATRERKRGGKLLAVPRGKGADLRPASDFDIATARPLAPEI